jgi:hypothetical protein
MLVRMAHNETRLGFTNHQAVVGLKCMVPALCLGATRAPEPNQASRPPSATNGQRPMSSTPFSGLVSERDDAMEAGADMEAGPETSRVSDLDASID